VQVPYNKAFVTGWEMFLFCFSVALSVKGRSKDSTATQCLMMAGRKAFISGSGDGPD